MLAYYHYTTSRLPLMTLVGPPGIEPGLYAPEAHVLPVYYGPAKTIMRTYMYTTPMLTRSIDKRKTPSQQRRGKFGRSASWRSIEIWITSSLWGEVRVAASVSKSLLEYGCDGTGQAGVGDRASAAYDERHTVRSR